MIWHTKDQELEREKGREISKIAYTILKNCLNKIEI